MVTRWNGMAAKVLVDKKIVAAEYIKDAEFGNILCIMLDDGTTIFPMADDEGNGPGSLHWSAKSDSGGEHNGVLPVLFV
jgi:hypothetical protein